MVAHLNGVQVVAGSNPAGPTKTKQDKGFSDVSVRESRSDLTCHSGAQLLSEAISAFVLSRQVGNRSSRTVEMYEANLGWFQRDSGARTFADCDALTIQRHLTALRSHMRPISTYQHFVCLRALFTWCVEAGFSPLTRCADSQ